MKKLLSLVLLLCLAVSPALAYELSEPGVYPISDERLQLHIWCPQIATLEDFETSYENVWFEEYANVDVLWETANSSEASQKFSLSLANPDRPDIYLNSVSTDEVMLYAEDGVIIPLEELIDEHTVYIKKMLDENPEIRAQITAPDGHIYQLFQSIYMAQESTDKMWVYKPWLETYMEATGKGTPATTEEFRDMLSYFRDNDMNGNGDPNDEIPLTGNYQYWKEGADPMTYLMNAFTLCPTRVEPYMLADEENHVTCVAVTDAYREGLKYINSLYEDKLLAEETYVQDLFQFRTLTSVPKTAVTVGAAAAPYPYRLLTYNADPAYVTFTDYVPLAPLKGPDGVQGCYTSAYDVLNMRTFITSSCEDPVVAIKWLDYFYSEEGRSWSNFYGKEGVHWAWTDEPSFGGGDRSVKLLVEYGSTQNVYWPQNWGPNTIRTRADYDAKAAADAATDNQLQAILAQDVYDPYAVHTNFPQITWCTDQDLIDERIELKDLVTNCILEHTTQFIVGAEDIDDDAAWASFLAELDNLGLARLLELHETYYFDK